MENHNEKKKIIEGLLFAWGEPLKIKDISEILEVTSAEIMQLLEEMMEDFEENRGLKIIKIGNTYQLTTKEEHYHWLKELSLQHERTRLSNAAIETLSIIAYKQPVTRSEIEAIRGVKSDKVLDSLLNRYLIEEVGRLDQPGKPIIYGTTNEFLKFFSIESLNELPEIEEKEDINTEN